MTIPKSAFFVLLLCLLHPIVQAETPPTSVTPASTTLSKNITATNGIYSLPFHSREEIENFLKSAKIIKDKMLGEGITNPHKLTLEEGNIQRYGVFKSIDDRRFGITQLSGGAEVDFKDSWKFEVAAYELDKLIRLNMVPVTVERAYKGSKGSLQIWVPNCMTEDDRLKKNLTPPDRLSWRRELAKMHVFDALIYNSDRNQGNLLITSDWKLFMIDHSRTFKNLDILRGAQDLNYFSRSMMDSIKKLDKASLMQHCGHYLMTTEIETMLKRRDLLVQLYNKVLAERGDAATFP